jgi:hypothetical protein
MYPQSVPGEHAHLSSNNRYSIIQMGPKTQKGDFNENISNDFDYISVIYGDHLPK